MYRDQVHCVFKSEMETNFALRSRRFLELFGALAKACRKEGRLKEFMIQFLMPLLKSEIKICEMRRGIGTDNSLR